MGQDRGSRVPASVPPAAIAVRPSHRDGRPARAIALEALAAAVGVASAAAASEAVWEVAVEPVPGSNAEDVSSVCHQPF